MQNSYLVNRGDEVQSRQWSNTGGFTLLELLVVIAIIGMLAAYVGPKYFAQLSQSERGAAKAQIEGFAKALDNFRLDAGRYPTTGEGLRALLVKPADVSRWNGPYLQKGIPNDPWGRPYQYRQPGTAGADFDLISNGKTGLPNGSGYDAPITNH